MAEAILPLLADPDSDVRLAVARALGELGYPAAIESLVLALTDDESSVRQAAERSLEQIDVNWTQGDAAQRAGSQLEAALENRPDWVRAAAMQVLRKLRAAAPV